MVKNLPAMWETHLVPGLGRSPGEGNGSPLQFSCLENPMNRGAWGLQFIGLKQSDMTKLPPALPPPFSVYRLFSLNKETNL